MPAKTSGETVGDVLTADIREFLDDPPPSSAGFEGAYYHHLVPYFRKLKPPILRADVERQQFVADRVWELNYDPHELLRRIPRSLIFGKPAEPAKAEPLDRRAQLIKELSETLEIARRRQQAEKRAQHTTTGDAHV